MPLDETKINTTNEGIRYRALNYRAEKKSVYVLLSNSQAGLDRIFSQPRTNLFSHLCRRTK